MKSKKPFDCARFEKELRDLLIRHGVAELTVPRFPHMCAYGFDRDGEGLFEFSNVTVGGEVSGEVEEYSA